MRNGNQPAAERAGLDRLRLELKRAAGPGLLYILLVVAGLATGADIIRNLAGDKPWISYRSYRMAFSDVKGVVPGRVELRLAGVKAGSITKSQMVGGQAVLTVNLERKYAPLYRDAVVRIRPVTPLEDMYVDITSRGHKRAGVLPGNQVLPESQTTSPVEIGTVLDVFSTDTRGHLATLLDELGRGLPNRGRDLRWAFVQLAPFLRSAQRLSVALDSRRVNLARLVHQFGGIAHELGNHDRQLTTFVQTADATLGQLAHEDVPFRGTLAQLPPTLSAMQSAFANLRQTENVLDPTLRSLEPVASALPSGLDALSKFSVAATPALRALRPSAAQLRPLARALLPTANSLAPSLTLLKTEAPQIDEFTQKTVPCLPETSQLLARAMSFTKFGDVNSAGANVGDARADVRVSFATVGQLFKDPAWHLYTPCNMKGGHG
ncbi:MAG: MCE-family protein Mce6D [Solirubrobacterales bacterium]|nr:MCE-family protein Mce6D [Solirubrobacterales bacterium]